MNRRKLLNYLLSTGDYCFKIDNFLIPKRLISERGYPINLEYNRQQNVDQGSFWSPNFRKVLEKKYKKTVYIREFPLIIQDQDVWRGLCNKYCVSDIEHRRKNYFVADYFFPRQSMLVEIDLDYHLDVYDNARDEYVQNTYGISTLRFYKFGEKKAKDKQYIRDFNSWLAKRKGLVTSLDYTTMILEKFNKANGDIIQFLDFVEANLNKARDGIFDLSAYSHLLSGWDAVRRIDMIISNIYGIRVVVSNWRYR